MEYTRALGSNAVQFLAAGGSHAIMNLADGEPSPIAFADVRDPVTGRTAVRRVNLDTEAYRTTRRFMRRMERADLADRATLAGMAAAVGLDSAGFSERYGYVVAGDPEHWNWRK